MKSKNGGYSCSYVCVLLKREEFESERLIYSRSHDGTVRAKG